MTTETKTCTGKCKTEKPLSEFHRRGYRHQNICKACRLEASKLPHTTRTSKDNTGNYEAIGARIEKLQARLRMIAQSYSKDPHEAEDIFQFICEKLLLQADPADSDARILTTAKRRASDFLEAERTYTFFVGAEAEIGGAADDEEECDAFEMFVADGRSAEDEITTREHLTEIQKAISTLTPENRKVVAMLSEGLNQADIARELGVTRSAVSIRMSLIADKLGKLGLTAA